VGACKIPAMTEEEKQIVAANDNFYRVFESFDIQKMADLWLREPYVVCVHPGWNILRGWEPVIESWRRIFENTSDIRFLLTDVSVRTRGSIAIVTLYENISSAADPARVTTVVATTNMFEKRPGGWGMVHHHGSPVASAPPRPSSPTVH
jgi:ketosteroid isomerase-like protein